MNQPLKVGVELETSTWISAIEQTMKKTLLCNICRNKYREKYLKW